METFLDPKVAHGQRQSWYPWPYVEGVTVEEGERAAFIGTGLYGKGPVEWRTAALCVAMEIWIMIKSIVKFTFTDKPPVSFWEQLNDNEYGFWANVNPEIDHPRWSQAQKECWDR